MCEQGVEWQAPGRGRTASAYMLPKTAPWGTVMVTPSGTPATAAAPSIARLCHVPITE